MPKGIIIFGPSGAGKSSLGKLLAKTLNYPYFDLDDYIWQKTAIPYTKMYSQEDKIKRLMHDINQSEHFVMAGSMSSFHEPFLPFFELGIFLDASDDIRIERLNKRAIKLYGSRVLVDGDMHINHLKFLENSQKYHSNLGKPSINDHLAFANKLPCDVLKLNGNLSLNHNLDIILKKYNEV